MTPSDAIHCKRCGAVPLLDGEFMYRFLGAAVPSVELGNIQCAHAAFCLNCTRSVLENKYGYGRCPRCNDVVVAASPAIMYLALELIVHQEGATFINPDDPDDVEKTQITITDNKRSAILTAWFDIDKNYALRINSTTFAPVQQEFKEILLPLFEEARHVATFISAGTSPDLRRLRMFVRRGQTHFEGRGYTVVGPTAARVFLPVSRNTILCNVVAGLTGAISLLIIVSILVWFEKQ
jgi:hypothetical protein